MNKCHGYMHALWVMSWCCTHQLLNTHFELYLDIMCIAVGKNGKENMEA